MLLICEHALSKQNFQIALLMCNNLIKLNFNDAWKCVKELAISLINTKTQISSSNILSSTTTTQHLLASIKRISTNIYNLNDTESSDDEIYLQEISKLLSFALTYCDNESLDEILALQVSISNKITKNSLNYQQEEEKEEEMNPDFKLDLTTTDQFCSYDNSNNTIDKLAYFLIGLIKFDKQNDEIEQNDRQFLKNIENLLKLDLNLVVSYFLHLNTRIEIYYIELIINNIGFNNKIAYEFLLYIITMTILGKFNLRFKDTNSNLNLKSSLYYPNLENLVKMTRKINVSDNNLDENLTKLLSLFTKIDNLHTEYLQLNELNDLHKKINIEYTFELSCNLAKLNSLNLWDI
jgi:hypothetical protein